MEPRPVDQGPQRLVGNRLLELSNSVPGGDATMLRVLLAGSGGRRSVDNCWPAHSLCNNFRWHYSAEEFQWILKLGGRGPSRPYNHATLGPPPRHPSQPL